MLRRLPADIFIAPVGSGTHCYYLFFFSFSDVERLYLPADALGYIKLKSKP